MFSGAPEARGRRGNCSPVRSIPDLTSRCEFKNTPLKSFFLPRGYINPDCTNCNQCSNLMHLLKEKTQKLKQYKTFIATNTHDFVRISVKRQEF